MKFYAKRRNVKKRPAKKTVKKAIKRNSNRIFEKKVLKVIHKQAETKEAYTTPSAGSLTFFNSGISSTADMLQVLPNIQTSVLDNGRVGDQIRLQKFNIKGYLKLDINTSGSSNSDLTAVYCRLFVLSLKQKPNYTDATSSSTPLSVLLKKGGTTTNFSGQLSDMMAPVNTDVFTVHADRKFYLNQSMLQNFNNTLNAIVPIDMKNTVKFFNIPVRCKNKLLKYDNGTSSGLLPTNYGPFLCLGYCFLNGASADVVSTRVGLHYISTVTYEDC